MAIKVAYPQAEVWALAPAGERDALLAAGVDRVVEIAGRRFGALNLPVWRIIALRWRTFEAIAVPQMTTSVADYANVYRLIALLRTRVVKILSPGSGPVDMSPLALRCVVASHSLRPIAERVKLARVRIAQVRQKIMDRWDRQIFLLIAVVVKMIPRRRGGGSTESLRVLHVISTMGLGGAQMQLASLLNHAPSTQSPDVLVLCQPDGDFSRRFIRRPNVSVNYVAEWPSLTRSVIAVARACQKRRYDVVHTWLFSANLVGVAGARLAGVPRIVLSVRAMSGGQYAYPSEGAFARLADVLTARSADAVTVNATALVGNYAKWALMPHRRIAVVHNGIDRSRLTVPGDSARADLAEELRLRPGQVVIGTVGRLSPEKDQETFLRILAILVAGGHDLLGVIVGEGPERDNLERLAVATKLRHRVAFLGRRNDPMAVVRGLDVLLVTSKVEGFPNVLLEATMLGVPCVATDVGGNSEVLGPGAVLFPPSDAEEGARAVLSCLSSPTITANRVRAAYRRASQMFSADRSTAAWLSHYGAREVTRSRHRAHDYAIMLCKGLKR